MQIRDRNNPLNHDWFIDYYIPYLDVVKDYALVLRATDPKTEQMTVTAAGLSLFGTIAAGEFLTNPNEMQKLNAIAPKGGNTGSRALHRGNPRQSWSAHGCGSTLLVGWACLDGPLTR